ncbi:DUF4249 domain-containing protein [Parvicella tangerina]|nr:DUF4249 domain-containing protein [Parvicella tangerina]
MTKNIAILVIAVLALISCQKAIEVDLPEVDQDYVVEGRIELGTPPIVILSETQGYFDEASVESVFGTFVHGATINMSTSNGDTFPLTEICSSSIPDSLLDDVSALTGIPAGSLGAFDYCVYTSFDPDALGEENVYYHLDIDIDGQQLKSSTKIPWAVPLDSTWFEVEGDLDSLGFVWAYLTDPDTVGNYYRWYAQRINVYDYSYPDYEPDVYGQMKDPFPIAPFGSIVDDKFFNGLTFDFAYSRGEIGNLEGPDDEGPEEGYFKSGDTVVIKFCSTTRENFLYIRALENQAATAGSPFASPGNLPFNIEGGIGIWAGYAPAYDTLICE